MLKPKNIVAFDYHNKVRVVKVVEVKQARSPNGKYAFGESLVTGFDLSVGELGAFRSFKPNKMKHLTVLN